MPITHVNSDLARQFTTTTGTGTLSMGTVPTGLRSIVAAVGSGKKARFKLVASDGVNWEIFEGTVTAGSPDTVSRDTVIASTNGGAKIVLPAGTHTLDATWIAKSADEVTPRLLTAGNGVTLATGTLTIDCMGSCDVFAVLSLTANITSVVLQNVPERCSLYLEVTQSGGPWTFPQNAWPAGTVLDSIYNLFTDATKSCFWWTTTDGGSTSILECNGPITAISNAKLANMAASTIKGRVTASTGVPEDLTAEQARAIIEAAAPSVVTVTASTTLTKAAHQGKVLYCTTGALSLTVDNASDFDPYASCEIVNKTGAVVTFVATATISRIGSKPLTLPANGRATLMREAAADIYLLTGEMA